MKGNWRLGGQERLRHWRDRWRSGWSKQKGLVINEHIKEMTKNVLVLK